MKLVAAMLVAEVEVDRYLGPCVDSLLEFCDSVVLLPDGDQQWPDRNSKLLGLVARWDEYADGEVRVANHEFDSVDFYAHEGRARQQLLEITLDEKPTHVLAIDADEFVADGGAVRAACEDDAVVSWQLCMQEVWKADGLGLELRQDGGWDEHDVTMLWAPHRLSTPPRMADRALACGRVPEALRGVPGGHTGTAVLHFGWANEAERAARHARYVQHDGGRFHASAHLDSILLPDTSITLTSRAWPPFTNRRRAAILQAATPATDAVHYAQPWNKTPS